MQNPTNEGARRRRTRIWATATASAVALAVIATTVYAQAKPEEKVDKAAVTTHGAANKLPDGSKKQPDKRAKHGHKGKHQGGKDKGKDNGKNNGKGKNKGNDRGPITNANMTWMLGSQENVEFAANAGHYDTMINTLRANAGPMYRDGMRRTTSDENRYIEMEINLGEQRQVTLIFQAQTLYLVGWRTNNPNEEEALFALEGADLSDLQRRPDSLVRTRIPQHYQGLGMTDTTRESLIIGRNTLINAAETLRGARTTNFERGNGFNDQRMRRALGVLIIATAEAARFSPLSRQIHGFIREGAEDRHLSEANNELINSWTDASRLAYDIDDGNQIRPERAILGPHIDPIRRWQEIAAVLALAKFLPGRNR